MRIMSFKRRYILRKLKFVPIAWLILKIKDISGSFLFTNHFYGFFMNTPFKCTPCKKMVLTSFACPYWKKIQKLFWRAYFVIKYSKNKKDKSIRNAVSIIFFFWLNISKIKGLIWRIIRAKVSLYRRDICFKIYFNLTSSNKSQ